MIKLSKTSKLGCLSWSLQAIDTCPGSVDVLTGGLVEACQGCYATTGNYRFANVKAPREYNREDWKRDGWVDDMVAALDDSRYFRWFDSGDMYDVRLAEKILAVMERTQWVKHWLPTRIHKFGKFADVLARMDNLPNVVVRRSLDKVFVDNFEVTDFEYPLSGIIADPTVPTDATVCGAYQNDGKCGSCRACWNPSVHAIAYPAHGVKMNKVIMMKRG
jgi:hypothetical protein